MLFIPECHIYIGKGLSIITVFLFHPMTKEDGWGKRPNGFEIIRFHNFQAHMRDWINIMCTQHQAVEHERVLYCRVYTYAFRTQRHIQGGSGGSSTPFYRLGTWTGGAQGV